MVFAFCVSSCLLCLNGFRCSNNQLTQLHALTRRNEWFTLHGKTFPALRPHEGVKSSLTSKTQYGFTCNICRDLQVATEESFNGQLSDIEDKFKEQLQELVRSLLAADNIVVKEVNGQKITCKTLFDYFKAYVEIFKNGQLPEPKSALQMIAEVNNLQAVATAKDAYMNAMEKLCGGDQPYLSSADLAAHHSTEKRCAMKLFASAPKMGIELCSEEYSKNLEKAIDAAFCAFAARNDEKTRHRTTVVLLGMAAVVGTASGGFAQQGWLRGQLLARECPLCPP